MNYTIIPITYSHIEGFREAVDSVAREQRFLTYLEAPSVKEVDEFVRDNIKNGHTQFVATIDNAVVGWCDIIPKKQPACRHIGVLGMGSLWGRAKLTDWKQR